MKRARAHTPVTPASTTAMPATIAAVDSGPPRTMWCPEKPVTVMMSPLMPMISGRWPRRVWLSLAIEDVAVRGDEGEQRRAAAWEVFLHFLYLRGVRVISRQDGIGAGVYTGPGDAPAYHCADQ